MLVTAIKRGYYKRIREPGDQFEFPIKKGEKLGTWMIPTKQAAAAKAAAHAESAEEYAEQARKDEVKAAATAEAAAERAAQAQSDAETEADAVGSDDDDDLLGTGEESTEETESLATEGANSAE